MLSLSLSMCAAVLTTRHPLRLVSSSPRSTTSTRSWRPCPRRSEPAESTLVVAGGCGAAGGVRDCRVCVVEWGVTMRLAELSFGPEEKDEEEKEDPPFNSFFLFSRHVCASCRRKGRKNGDIGIKRGTTKAGGSWGERGTSERERRRANAMMMTTPFLLGTSWRQKLATSAETHQ